MRARQAGFVAATGELIANLDADTRLPPGWLAQVLTRFARDPALVALSGPCIYDDLSAPVRLGVRLFYALAFVSYLTTRFVLNRTSLLQGGNYVIRRDALRAIGGYNPALEFYGEDTDVAYRLHPLGQVVFTPRLPIYASGRRLAAEGVLRTGVTYSLNYLWVLLFRQPFSRAYRAIRPPGPRPPPSLAGNEPEPGSSADLDVWHPAVATADDLRRGTGPSGCRAPAPVESSCHGANHTGLVGPVCDGDRDGGSLGRHQCDPGAYGCQQKFSLDRKRPGA